MLLAFMFFASFASAQPEDTPPVALAGVAFMAYPDEVVILDGSGSYDDDGDVLSFRWTQVGGPDVGLSKGDSPHPEWTAQRAGVHSFELVVSDGDLSSEPDQVDVIVVDPEAGTRLDPPKGCATLSPRGLGLGASLLVLLGLARRREA